MAVSEEECSCHLRTFAWACAFIEAGEEEAEDRVNDQNQGEEGAEGHLEPVVYVVNINLVPHDPESQPH